METPRQFMKAADRRFIENWKDQRKGSRFGYYLTYIIGWSVVSFFVLFFLSKLFTNLWETGGKSLVYIFAAIAFIAAFLITHLTYSGNEKKLHRLIEEYKEELN